MTVMVKRHTNPEREHLLEQLYASHPDLDVGDWVATCVYLEENGSHYTIRIPFQDYWRDTTSFASLIIARKLNPHWEITLHNDNLESPFDDLPMAAYCRCVMVTR